jgi:site-specific recombinase XerD
MDLTTAAQQFSEIKPWARHGVAAFLAYCQVEDTSELEAADLSGYLDDLASKGYAATTIRAYRTGANAFFRWLVDRDLAPFGPKALNQAFVQQYKALPSRNLDRAAVPAEQEVRALIEAAHAAAPAISPDTARGWQRHLAYLRNIAIVEMLRATGIRSGELVALRRCHLDLARQCAYAPDGRRLYFDLESWGALARYLEARGDPVAYPLLMWQAPVFARHDTSSAGPGLKPLSLNRVERIIAGLRKSGTTRAKDLRARFAQRLLEATTDERGTARLLGLKHVPSVRRYRPDRK